MSKINIDTKDLKTGCVISFDYEGKNYFSVAQMVDHKERYVAVYVPYAGGQDMIPFENILAVHKIEFDMENLIPFFDDIVYTKLINQHLQKTIKTDSFCDISDNGLDKWQKEAHARVMNCVEYKIENRFCFLERDIERARVFLCIMQIYPHIKYNPGQKVFLKPSVRRGQDPKQDFFILRQCSEDRYDVSMSHYPNWPLTGIHFTDILPASPTFRNKYVTLGWDRELTTVTEDGKVLPRAAEMIINAKYYPTKTVGEWPVDPDTGEKLLAAPNPLDK